MTCCHSVLSAAASAASSRSTPSWLHRLHAKGGLSFPSHLHIDDLLYGQPPPPLPPPPPSSSSNQQHAVAQELPPKAKHPKPKQQKQQPPRSNNSSRPIPSSTQPLLSAIISDLFVIPSDRPPPSTLKAFRKQSRPRPRPDNSPPPHKDNKDKKAKAKARKRRRAERAADADGERSTKTEVTVIDTSTDGWKAAKLLVRKGAVWKVRDKEASGVSEPEDLNKGKRRAGLVSKMQRDMEKEKEEEKEATLQASFSSASQIISLPPRSSIFILLSTSSASVPRPPATCSKDPSVVILNPGKVALGFSNFALGFSNYSIFSAKLASY